MRKLKLTYSLFLAFCTIGFVTKGQTYTITDSDFRMCLSTRYPATINTSNTIINSEAEKLTSLVCTNSQIKSIEGLQAFKNLIVLDLKNNQITEVPTLDNLTKLTFIDVSSNSLLATPSLSKNRVLKELYIHKNNIRQLPNFNSNDSLTTIYAHTNNFDTLPDLRSLKKLSMLHLAHNKLKYLPYLSELTSIKFLNVWSNNLVEIPSLEKLTSLEEINIGYNNLTKSPALFSQNPVKIMYINDNYLTEINTIKTTGILAKVRLYNNNLSFKELNKCLSTPNYDSIFKIESQYSFKVGKMILVKEKEELVLSTGIDQGVTGVEYYWFKNSDFIQKSNIDKFSINKIELKDKGYYYCQIKSSNFPAVTLKTDSFSVNVQECVTPDDLFISKSIKNCVEGASINIQSAIQIKAYELIPLISNQTIANNTGNFKGLTELQYNLKVTTPTGCQKQYPTTIILETEVCDEVVISPNGDGLNDSYTFEQKGDVDIYDRRGNLIQSLKTPASWDGTSKNGKVSAGFYMVDINKGEKQLGITVIY